MKVLATIVLCRECGKELRGRPALRRGFYVSAHKRPNGKPCAGRLFTDHPPKTAR